MRPRISLALVGILCLSACSANQGSYPLTEPSIADQKTEPSVADTNLAVPDSAKVSSQKILSSCQEVTTPSGLRLKTKRFGGGRACHSGDTVVVNYTGSVLNGDVFESSYERNNPLEFTLGQGQVIAGWEAGIPGMKVGEQRQLIVPPALGYGETGCGNIPANVTLKYDIELVDIK